MRSALVVVTLVLVLLAGVATVVAVADHVDAPSDLPGTPTPVSSTSSPSATPVASQQPVPELAEVYRRLGESLRGNPSEVVTLHVEAVRSGAEPVRWTIWADPQSDAARREFTAGAGPDSPMTIADEEAAYSLGANASITIDRRICPEADAAVSMITDCPNRPFETYVFDPAGNPRETTETPEITVRRTEYEGQPVVEVAATKYQQPFRASPFSETRRLLLAADSYLPIRMEVTQDPGVTEVFRYESEVVPAASLPPGFFDPLSLPSLRPDPEDALREGVTSAPAYWLGAQFEGGSTVPSLTLWRSSRYQGDPADPSTEQVMLEYVRSSDLFGQQLLVRLTEYTAAEWDRRASQAHLPTDPCWTEQSLTLPEGTATIFSGFHWEDSIPPASAGDCPSNRTPDRFLGVVSIGGVVVVVEPWDWPEQSYLGVAAIAEALAPWPGD